MTGPALALLGLLAAATSPPTLLVLPPETAPGDIEATRLAEAVSDLLPHALDFLGTPVVARADRLLALEQLEIPPVALTRATWIRVAEALQAPRLVTGRLSLQGDVLSLSLQVLDVGRGSLSAPLSASGSAGAIGELVDQLAWDVALAGASRPGRTKAELLARRRAPPRAALSAYALGLTAAETSQRTRQLRRALQLAPRLDEARLELGRLLLAGREHQAAYDALAGVQAEEMARVARFLQGRALLEMGRYRDAGMLYAGLVAGDPTPAALNNNALALLRQDRPALSASDVLRKALDLAPGDPDLAFNLGFALLSEGDPAAASFWLQGVLRRSPRDSQARALMSWALRRAGRTDEADEAWRAVLALAPSLEPLAREDLSRRFERVAPSERRLVPDEAARSHAELAAAHLGRAEKALQAEDPETGERELSQAAFSDPYNPRVHLRLARVARERGDIERSVSELRIAIWCRDDPAVRVELAQQLMSLGREAEARREARQALKLDPANEGARRLAEGK